MSLKSLIETRFTTAVCNGHLIFTPTIMHKLIDKGMEFHVRSSTTLAKKPAGSGLSKVKLEQVDPFMPPDNNLLVKSLEYRNLVLNKYAISKHHLLITAKDYETQYSMPNIKGNLKLKDLKVVGNLLKEINEPDILFFYNCGTASGASVLHKHVQMLRCLDIGIPVSKLVENSSAPDGSIFEIKELPYMHLCVKMKVFDADDATRFIHDMINDLYDRIEPNSFERYTKLPIDLDIEPIDFISYNLLMTESWIMIVPRRTERWNGMGLNSVAFAGFIFAKSEQDLVNLQKVGPMSVLEQIGYSKVQSKI